MGLPHGETTSRAGPRPRRVESRVAGSPKGAWRRRVLPDLSPLGVGGPSRGAEGPTTSCPTTCEPSPRRRGGRRSRSNLRHTRSVQQSGGRATRPSVGLKLPRQPLGQSGRSVSPRVSARAELGPLRARPCAQICAISERREVSQKRLSEQEGRAREDSRRETLKKSPNPASLLVSSPYARPLPLSLLVARPGQVPRTTGHVPRGKHAAHSARVS